MNFINATRTRVFAILAVLLMFMSMVGGVLPTSTASGASFITASYAAEGGGNKGVNDLWNTVTADGVGEGLDKDTNLESVVNKGQELAKAITSILTIISFVCLLFWIARLAMSAGNPQTRKIALSGIMFAGIALALFGGSWVVVSFFWNILNTTV